MTAVEVGATATGGQRVNWRDIVRIAQSRRTSADDYTWTGESGANTTTTITIVGTPATGSITIDYAET